MKCMYLQVVNSVIYWQGQHQTFPGLQHTIKDSAAAISYTTKDWSSDILADQLQAAQAQTQVLI